MARQGRTGHWTADDTEAARRMANELHYPHGPLRPTPQEAFRARPPISVEARAAFGRTVEHEQAQERIKEQYVSALHLRFNITPHPFFHKLRLEFRRRHSIVNGSFAPVHSAM